MTDTQFDLFQIITAFAVTLTDAFCLALLFYPYIPDHKIHKSRRVIKALWMFAAYTLLSVIGIIIPKFGLFGAFVLIPVMWLLAYPLQMCRRFAVFLTLIYLCFNCSIRLVGNSILFLLNRNVGESTEEAMLNTAVNYAAVYLAEAVILALLTVIIIRRVLTESLHLSTGELGFLCIIPLIGIIVGEIVERLLFMVKDNVIFEIYAVYPAFLIFIPVIGALFCVGIILSIVSYTKIQKLQEEKKKYFVAEQQVRAMRERINEVEHFYGGIRKMRHEMNNHLTNIKGLTKNKRYADIEQYISQMDSELRQFELTEKTGDPVLDVIVNDKKKYAEKCGIGFVSDFQYPSSGSFNAYDIGIIVNNLLVNAIEACEKMTGNNRYVTLSGCTKKKFYIITVSNSYENDLKFDNKSGLPLSSKSNPEAICGIGLSNVKQEAEKYTGVVDIKAEDNIFTVTVLLQDKNFISER